MTTATLASTSANKHNAAGLAQRIRSFAIELYLAHGGWFVVDAAQPASGALASETLRRNAQH